MAYLSHEQVTVSNTALTVSSFTIPAGATHVELQSSSNNARYTMDGSSTATASVGMTLVADADPKTFLIEDLRNISIIREGGSDAAVEVHYFAGRDV